MKRRSFLKAIGIAACAVAVPCEGRRATMTIAEAFEGADVRLVLSDAENRIAASLPIRKMKGKMEFETERTMAEPGPHGPVVKLHFQRNGERWPNTDGTVGAFGSGANLEMESIYVSPWDEILPIRNFTLEER